MAATQVDTSRMGIDAILGEVDKRMQDDTERQNMAMFARALPIMPPCASCKRLGARILATFFGALALATHVLVWTWLTEDHVLVKLILTIFPSAMFLLSTYGSAVLDAYGARSATTHRAIRERVGGWLALYGSAVAPFAIVPLVRTILHRIAHRREVVQRFDHDDPYIVASYIALGYLEELGTRMRYAYHEFIERHRKLFRMSMGDYDRMGVRILLAATSAERREAVKARQSFFETCRALHHELTQATAERMALEKDFELLTPLVLERIAERYPPAVNDSETNSADPVPAPGSV